MNKISNQFSSIEQITDQYLKKSNANAAAAESILAQAEAADAEQEHRTFQ